MPRKEGWNGRVFEDFEVGEVYEHALGRTVTTAGRTTPVRSGQVLSVFGKPPPSPGCWIAANSVLPSSENSGPHTSHSFGPDRNCRR